MKLNFFLALCGLAICGLIGYGFYAAGTATLITIVSTICCVATLPPALSLSLNGRPRGTILFRIASLILFAILLIVNIIFGCLNIAPALYIIVNGLLVVLGMIKLYLIVKSGQ